MLPGINSTLLCGNDDTLCCDVGPTANFGLQHGPLVDDGALIAQSVEQS